jgi:hypothetical protein
MFLSYKIVYLPFFNYVQMFHHLTTKMNGKGAMVLLPPRRHSQTCPLPCLW